MTSCPACGRDGCPRGLVAGGAERQRFLDYSRIKYGGLMDGWLDGLELALCRCPDCGHYWYFEQPDAGQLAAMYEAGRPIVSPGEPGRLPTLAMVDEMRRLRRLARGRAPALLDYGSGFGRWARAAAEAGFAVVAYEPSARRGAEQSPPFALVRDLAEVGSRTFDAVNVEQVLEHVPDPLTSLEGIRGVCAPDGVVRITTPNVLRPLEGRDFRRTWPFDGRRPHTMAPFEHLHGFTPASLACLAARAGLRPVGWARLAFTFPGRWVRAPAGWLWSRLGQTFALVEPDPARPAGRQ